MPLYSCVDAVYDVTRLESPHARKELQRPCFDACCLFLLLLPMVEADLRRPWLSTVLATGASVDFVFGVSAVRISKTGARTIGRPADATNAYVRLDRTISHPNDEPEQSCKVPHKLGLSKHLFVSLISSRKRRASHLDALEATGLTLGVRWFSRKRSNHGRRFSIYCGRTGSYWIRRERKNFRANDQAQDAPPRSLSRCRGSSPPCSLRTKQGESGRRSFTRSRAMSFPREGRRRAN